MILRILNENIDKIEKPSRYIGGEYNQIVKDLSETKLRVGLVFPDLYEVGMSNLGLLIIYYVLNSLPRGLGRESLLTMEGYDRTDEAKRR